MKKILGIIALSFLLSGYAYANVNCSEERKQWIQHLKKEVGSSYNNPVYSNNKCIVELIEHDGIPIEEHKQRLSSDNRDNLKVIVNKKNDETSYDLLADIEVPTDINWVPKDFKTNNYPDYVDGLKYFNNQKYDEAALFFGDFLENNLKHHLVPEVQFKYGETFRLREDYVEAAYQYLDVYVKFNGNEFAPISLVRLGEMMIKIDYKDKGCELLNLFDYEFPYADDQIYLESESLLKKYQCTKTVITDSKILLSKIIKDTENLIK